MYKSDYPTYLVHFNKNHDPKNGQFAEGDGDGDGIANDHKNRKMTPSKKNIESGYQLRNGRLTNEGQKHVDIYNQSNEKMKNVNDVIRKLSDTNYKVYNKEYGYDPRYLLEEGVYEHVDWHWDWNNFEKLMNKNGIDISDFLDAKTDFDSFYKKYKESIDIGRSIVMNSDLAKSVNTREWPYLRRLKPYKDWMV